MRRAELEAKTKGELLAMARRMQIAGRSQMSKDGLVRALMTESRKDRPKPFAPRRRAAQAESRDRRAMPPKPTEKRAARPKATEKRAARPKKDRTPGPARPAIRKQARRTGRRRRAEGPYGPESEKLHGGARGPSATVRTKNGRPAPRTRLGAPLEMPEHYGHDAIALLVRDPYWLFAYWEVTPGTIDALRKRLGAQWEDHRWVLRVFAFPPETDPAVAEEGNGEDRYDIDLPLGASSWYLNVGRPGRIYRVAVGIVTRDGTFHALARSNAVGTPRDTHSVQTDEEWTTPPETYTRLYESYARAADTGGRSSAELGLLLRQRLGADWSSGMLGSMGSGALRPAAGEAPGFWFVLDAELIIYGATEPDARVTVQGRPVPLRPDGSFSLRFQLPDGTQVIDATALSADGAFRKTITPTVRRETSAAETIENEVES